jgi:amino acid adenylation domain-containing protein
VTAAVDTFPLAFAQQRLWFLEQLEAVGPAYHLRLPVRLRGRLDVAALRRALAALSARHEALRTTIVTVGGEPRQAVHGDLPLPLAEEDLAGADDAALRGRLATLAAGPFDLARGPLCRATLLRLGPDDQVLLLVTHHLVSDAWSSGLLFRDLAALYAAECSGVPAVLPALPLQYADYAAWQRDRLRGPRLQAELDYWRSRLAGAPDLLDLPTDRPRPPAQTFRGSRYSRPLAPADLAALQSLAATGGATLFHVLLTGFQWLLARWSGQHDVVVGTPVAGRPRVELENVAGFFANTLALRTAFDPDATFGDTLARVRRDVLGDLSHQDVPFEELVRVLKPPRTLRHAPVFQVMFALQNAPWEADRFGDLAISPTEIAPATTSRFDLSLSAIEYQGELWLHFEYNTDLFDEATVARLADGYATLLAAAAAAPGARLADLPVMPAVEREQVVRGFNATAAECPAATLGQLVRAMAARRPDRVAVIDEAGQLTHAALLAEVDALAAGLVARGVGPGHIVAVCLPRGRTWLATLLAIEHCGAAWLPLDPDHPAARRGFVLADAGATLLVAGPADAVAAPGITVVSPAALRVAAPPSPSAARPDAPLYLIYTSGSTGQPKGVVVPARAVVNFLASLARRPGLAPGDRLLAVTTPAFDIAVLELFLPLVTGATVVIAGRDTAADPAALMAAFDDHDINVCQATPATWQGLVTAGWRGRAGLRVLVGGEALEESLAAALLARAAEVWNCYGPTETTVWSAVGRVTAPSPVHVGSPIANTRCYVLDGDGGPVPIGVEGELWIGGLGVAWGYHAREALTAERFRPDPFVPSPFDGEAAPRIYRTGDRARWRADGTLEVRGRLDQQIKLRGFRIEPGEVEAALAAQPGVATAVVVRHQAGDGDARLVGYVVATDAAAPETPRTAAVLAGLRGLLPDYMVPATLVWLPALPRTANGKLDRGALPAPDFAAGAAAAGDIAMGPVETALAAQFAVVLGLPRVGRDDDFFALGGHSLLAIRLLARLREEAGLDVALKQLFLTPTVAGLAAALGDVVPQARPLPSMTAPTPVPTAGTARRVPLSLMQQRLWVLEALDPGNSVYHLAWSARLTGQLERVALQGAVDAVVARHEVLRTVFVAGAEEGTAEQQVLATLAVPVEWIGASGLDAEGVRGLLAALARRPFDFARGPLVRVTVVSLSETEQVLVVVIHHIIADGWSLSVLATELSQAYGSLRSGEAPALAPLPVQYGDWALWQRQWLAGPEPARQLDYWRATLEGVPSVLDLGAERARPPTLSHRGARHGITLDGGLRDAVHAAATAHGCTPYMVLLAAWSVLLGRYGGTEDVVVGTPVAGRGQLPLEGLIGFFVNTLVMRVGLGGNPTVGELLARVRSVVLGALEHQDLPFEKLVEVLNPPRHTDRAPVFQVLFNFHTEPAAPFSFAGTTAWPVAVERTTTKFDLSLALGESPAGLHATFEYSTDLFGPEWIERLAAEYAGYLRVMTGAGGAALPVAAIVPAGAPPAVLRSEAAPSLPGPVPDGAEAPVAGSADDLPAGAGTPIARTAEDRHAGGWQAGGASPAGDAAVPAIVSARLRTAPDALAVSGRRPDSDSPDRITDWTMAELWSAASGVAAALRDLGLRPGSRVATWCHPGVAATAATLGPWLAGAVVVPLEPEWPAKRIEAIARDAGLAAVLADAPQAEAARRALPGLPVVAVAPPGPWHFTGTLPDAAAHAYLLYTSGTTGAPKGVLQTHGAHAAQVRSWAARLGLGAADRLSSLGSVASDTALQDLGAALATGASLHPLDVRRLARETVLDRIAAARLTALHLTPTLYRYLLGEHVSCRQDLSAVRLVVLGGEPARAADLALWRSRFAGRGSFVNGYGMTEATAILLWPAGATSRGYGSVLPVGRPVRDGEVWLRAEDGGEGSVIGEVVVASPHLAAGYWRLQGLEPLAGDGGFRTGDIARRLPDGSLAWAGRRDDRVKLAGHRVELGEVTAALAAQPGVTAAAAVLAADADGEPLLVGYYTPGAGAPGPAALQSALRQWLPAAALPGRLIAVDELPRLANGKVDRAALARRALPSATPGPSSPGLPELAGVLQSLWQDLLQRPVGPDDDFFALGGHSLLALRLLARIRKALGVDLPLLAVFEAPTVRQLAARLGRMPGAGDSVPAKTEEIQRLTRTPG